MYKQETTVSTSKHAEMQELRDKRATTTPTLRNKLQCNPMGSCSTNCSTTNAITIAAVTAAVTDMVGMQHYKRPQSKNN